PEGTPAAIALDIATDILSTGRSSRLYQRLVYQDQLASEVSAYVDLREAPGLVWFYAMANEADQDVAPIEKALEEVIAQVRNDLVGEHELEKAKNKMEMRLVASRVTASGKADQLAHSYTFFGDTQRVNSIIGEYDAITTEDIRRAAAEFLTPEKRCVVVYLPPKE
ncbi:MAG TPA: insulinase family protein, partial [Candidatus Kapabacteria bacterium]|nr:insulinase family protein [Candidatus Kapabacteria bacterium]